MDLLDYPNFDGDYITLYVYLTDVDNSQSPLKLVENSHKFGPTRFPHYLKKNKEKIVFFTQETVKNLIHSKQRA